MLLGYLLLVCVLQTWPCQGQQHYHYNRPQVAFHSGGPHHQPHPHAHHQQPQQPLVAHQGVAQPKTFLVQTLGPHGRTYEVQTHKSQAVFTSHQVGSTPGRHLTYGPPPPAAPAAQPVIVQVQKLPPQPQAPALVYQQPHQLHAPHHVQSPSNHLQYQAPPQHYQAPLPQQQYYQQQSTLINPLLTPPPPPAQLPASYYRQPQAQTAVAPGPVAPAHTGSNPQPYAIVKLPSGQSVQDGGHGNGPIQQQQQQQVQQQLQQLQQQQQQQSGLGPRLGDYTAQAQSSQLDAFNYKQTPVGDTRNYQRYITTCQPNGQCQRVTLGPGQVEPNHHQVLQETRAQTQPIQEACSHGSAVGAYAGGSYYRGGAAAAIAASYTPPGAEMTASGKLRPKNRRNDGNAYSESAIPRDPYN